VIPHPHPVLAGRNVNLERFAANNISEAYLTWLRDPEVNRHSRRAGRGPVSRTEAEMYLAGLAPDEIVLAIHHGAYGHVGNVKYGPVDWSVGRADISIILGAREVWNRGIGGEAVYLVSKFLLRELGLKQVDAGSINPAFVRMVLRLGWRIDGDELTDDAYRKDIFEKRVTTVFENINFSTIYEYEPYNTSENTFNGRE
jgi:RimJ/RimL family protein N-acetyltransferase